MADKDNIYNALAAAQAEMGKALKQSENPHFRSKYADLGSVMDACLPALNRHGIAVIQPISENELGRAVQTVFLHASGDKLETSVPLILGKNDMQGLGSAITYARRYGLMCLAGIAPEDDDGNAAAKAPAVMERTWVQTILDELPPDATNADKAEAVTVALCDQWKRKTTVKQLENEWDRRADAVALLEKYKDKHARVIDAYETQMLEVTPPNPDSMPEIA